MGLKVAVIGLSETTHEKAPWGDKDWQKWGLPWDWRWAELDSGFEMHDMRLLTSRFSERPGDYFDRLRDIPLLYMQEAYSGLPARRYPFEEVAQTTGAYWNSSPAYMLALAIHEGAEEIGIWGVDLIAADEYGYQKPNMEYLVGIARGRGIKVHIPEESALCKFQPEGITFFDHVPTYHKRYGWLG